MSTASVSIDRTSLSLSALVIADDGATYQLGMDGLGEPNMTHRTTSMPDSQDVVGSEPVSAVKEATSLPLTVIIKGSSSAALKTAVTALTDALSQFTFTATVTVDGQSDVWTCSPASWARSTAVQPGEVAQFFKVLTVTIPLPNPIAS